MKCRTMRVGFLLFGASLLLVPAFSQSSGNQPVSPWPAQPMRPDRAEDSYAIYSKLLPLGETATWPATFYDIRETTITVVEPNAPCLVSPNQTAIDLAQSRMNPHVAIRPPETDRQDYEEVLADFDSHCHESLTLGQNSWTTKVPVHLLNETEQREFRSTRHGDSPLANKYKGSPALYAFSQVYFNAHHTVALVYATHWCGGLCGQGFWVAFKRENGGWKQLHWSSSSWIS